MSLLATMRHGAFMIFQLLLEELSVPIVPLKCGKNEKETKQMQRIPLNFGI